MKKFALIVLAALMICALSACGHEHVIGPAATCTEPQICTECEEILVEATGHRPGAEATCLAPQLCEGCGIELAPQLEHTPGEAAPIPRPQGIMNMGSSIILSIHPLIVPMLA